MSPLKSLRNAVLRDAHFQAALEQLRDLEAVHAGQADRLEIPFSFRGAGHFKSIRPMQSIDEITRLYERICDLRPQRVLEIGTCHGGTLYLWCQAAAANAQILSVDLPEGDFGGGYHASRGPLYEAFSQPGQDLQLLRADSHSPDTRKMVEESLGGERLDFLFIDG
ncbi:MAG: hypothetical protein AAF191_08615, partial [Verrucomicrobiota bacterium]